MSVSKEEMDEFRTIYQEETGIYLSDAELSEMTHRLVNIVIHRQDYVQPVTHGNLNSMKRLLVMGILIGLVLVSAVTTWVATHGDVRKPLTPSLTKSAPQSVAEITPGDHSTLRAGYKLYKNNPYGFQLAYAETWLIEKNLSDGPLNYAPLIITSFYAKEPAQEEPVITNVAVYDKSSDTPLRIWLMKGYVSTGMEAVSTTNIPNLSEGTISTALAGAQQGSEGLLSYTERREGGQTIVEVGAVQVKGTFSYTRYITKNDSHRVYALEMRLPFQYFDTALFKEQFNAISSSFVILDQTH